MSFGGPPVTTETVEEADELLRSNEKESAVGNYAFQFHFITACSSCYLLKPFVLTNGFLMCFWPKFFSFL